MKARNASTMRSVVRFGNTTPCGKVLTILSLLIKHDTKTNKYDDVETNHSRDTKFKGFDLSTRGRVIEHPIEHTRAITRYGIGITSLSFVTFLKSTDLSLPVIARIIRIKGR
jgi:hypothetical protein